jgi:hypothetical protein
MWTYRFFCLELLARERKLRPLFWGHQLMLGLALNTAEFLAQRQSQSLERSERLRKECREAWDEHGDNWIASGVIVRPDSRPWLRKLEYRRVEPEGRRWDMPDLPFPAFLKFRLQP